MTIGGLKFKMQSPSPLEHIRNSWSPILFPPTFLGFQILSHTTNNSSPELPLMDDHHPHEPFELLLRDSIQRFHSCRRSGVSTFDSLTSIFSRIIQATPDPPLELLWFYSAVTFRTDELEVLQRVALMKELLGLMVSCTGGSSDASGLKKVAALAPVVYELHRLVGDAMFWFPEVREDLRCLIDGVVSYVSMCCYENQQGFSVMHRFSGILMDVVGVFLADKAQAESGGIEDLRLFFPMVTDEIRARIRDGREVDFLAGTVMCQVFLLSLTLTFSLEGCSKAPRPRADVHGALHQHATQVVVGFRDLNFFDTLLRMLLEPTLQVTHLVGYAGESILREVLYDVAITAQYKFLHPLNGYQLPGNSTEVALRWLLIVEKASQFLRARGDETKAISFESAFFESCIPGQLIESVIQKTGKIKPVVFTPAAIVRWFLANEESGLKIFNDHTLHTQLQAVASNSACVQDSFYTNPDTTDMKTSECNNSFDQEMGDSTNDSFTYPHFSTGFDGQRKRKNDRQDNAYHQAKFNKVHCHGNYVKEKCLHLEVSLDSGEGQM